MPTDGFYKVIGEAAADDTRRHLVLEGVQAGQTLVGWMKVAVQDVGVQIATADYFRPLYILGTEISPSVPSNVDDADTLKRETWFKGLFDGAVDAGVDDADNRMMRDIGYVVADPDDADDWFSHDGKIIIVGKKPDGTSVYGGWRFEIDVPQGTVLYKATLAIWHNLAYGAGTSLYDDFIDDDDTLLQNHSPVFGPAWVSYSGTAEIQSNNVRLSSVGSDSCRYTFATGEADGTLRCRCYISDAGSSGIIFRFADSQNYWIFFLQKNAITARLNTIALTNVKEPGDTHVFWSAYGYPYGAWYDLEIAFNGDSIIAKVNGEIVVSVTSDRHENEVLHGIYGTAFNGDYALWGAPFDFATFGMPDLEAACDDVDDSDDFDTGGLPGTRVLTTAKHVLGDISGWARDHYIEIDVTDSVQEIINRGNWSPENHISVIVYPQAGCANGERIRIPPHESGHPAKLGLMWEV